MNTYFHFVVRYFPERNHNNRKKNEYNFILHSTHTEIGYVHLIHIFRHI